MTSIFRNFRVFAALLVLALGAQPAFAAAATVTGVDASTANGVYGISAVIDITVTFSAPVTVTGTPTLTLATGSTNRVVNYTTTSGGNVLHFPYTVQAGDTSADLDYIATAPQLQLASGTIKDGSSVDADLTLTAPSFPGSLGAIRNIVIDTVPAVV